MSVFGDHLPRPIGNRLFSVGGMSARSVSDLDAPLSIYQSEVTCLMVNPALKVAKAEAAQANFDKIFE